MDLRYKDYITEWLTGNITGTNKNGASKHIKRYILEQQKHKCAKCNIDSWNNNPIILELEHKDGNSENNNLDNLECLCPNCHSQTPTYKNRNQGNGRHARRIRYSEGKSF
jgi:Zn finger protein HypA/HybF involved in hydrogenase expression